MKKVNHPCGWFFLRGETSWIKKKRIPPYRRFRYHLLDRKRHVCYNFMVGFYLATFMMILEITDGDCSARSRLMWGIGAGIRGRRAVFRDLSYRPLYNGTGK